MKSRKIIMCAFLLIIAFLGIANARLTLTQLKSVVKGEIGFTEFREKIQSTYASDKFYLNTSFVNLNGIFSRMIGKREINECTILDNGYVGRLKYEKPSVGDAVKKLTGLNEALTQMGIDFVYVQAAFKMDEAGELLPYGRQNHVHEGIAELIAELDRNQVNYIDFMPVFSQTPEDIEKYFFRTDHHWTSDTAFIASQTVVERLQECMGDQTDISAYVDQANWERRLVEDVFLGSYGRRVGVYAAGIDDFSYFVPKFDTQMLYLIAERGEIYEGRYEETSLHLELLDTKGDYFNSDCYSIYGKSNYPLTYHRNSSAPVDKKILILKDSFGRPVESFLSTIYTQVDAIDPREFEECSILEYVYTTKPDAVVFLMNPSTINDMLSCDLGLDEWTALKELPVKNVLPGIDIAMDRADHSFAYQVVYDQFEEDTPYTFSFEDADVLSGETRYVCAALINRNGSVISSKAFDIEDAHENGRQYWMFRTPQEDVSGMQLIVYNGLRGKTEGMEVTYRNVCLDKGYSFQ